MMNETLCYLGNLICPFDHGKGWDGLLERDNGVRYRIGSLGKKTTSQLVKSALDTLQVHSRPNHLFR